MTESAKRLRTWWRRNAWAWPVVFQIRCWWEKRYRPERWEGGAEGVILMSSGRSTRLLPGESWAEATDRLIDEAYADYPKDQP